MIKPVYRKSVQRQKIYELIKGSFEHPTAMSIYETLREKMPALSLGTVYRNLAILVEQGLVIRMPFKNGFDRFDANTLAHHHLICENCGKVEDISLPALAEIDKIAAKSNEFKILRHRIEFYGICRNCRKRAD